MNYDSQKNRRGLAGSALCALSLLSLLCGSARAETASPAKAPHVATTPLDSKKERPISGVSYLSNGVIKVGVDLDLGGAITYLSKADNDVNLVNSFDWGRQIQMSHYSGPVPFAPNGKQPKPVWTGLGWNPVQSGDVFGHRARVLAHANDGKTMHTKCIPMQWPLDNEPGECTFETWISLRGNVVNVSARVLNARIDKTQYKGRDQELPAVYTNGPWCRLVTYTGDKPFANDKTSDMPAVFPWTGWQATENWTALVDKNGFGLGVVSPGNPRTIGGFAGKPGAGGPKDSPTGYIAPLFREILDHNIDYRYSYHLIVGTLDEIRAKAITLTPHNALPDYTFTSDRQHWTYANAVDTGWPIRGELNVKTDAANPQILGPDTFWDAAKAPKLYIQAAFQTGENTARIFWKRLDQKAFTRSKMVMFKVVSDDKMRVYEVNLANSPEYKGCITGLRFDPANGGKAGSYVRIKYIGTKKPAP